MSLQGWNAMQETPSRQELREAYEGQYEGKLGDALDAVEELVQACDLDADMETVHRAEAHGRAVLARNGRRMMEEVQ